jgi:S1-C subfamily serine protease
MISSMTGSYVGYSFAVPSNIARKIIKTLWNSEMYKRILGVEGGELKRQPQELGITRQKAFTSVRYHKIPVPRSGLQKAIL